MNFPRAILFDADGTLFDSSPLHFEAYRLAAKRLYDFDFTQEVFDKELLRGSKKAWDVLQENGVSVDADVLHKYKRQIFLKLAQKQLKPMPGIVECLGWCQQQGLRCIVVSTSLRHSLETSLAILGLENFFENIVSYEDAGTKQKPHPYPYLSALRIAKLDTHEAMAVEDTAKGITSAKAAGLYCVGIRNQTNSVQELAAADHMIKHYRELPPLLRRVAS